VKVFVILRGRGQRRMPRNCFILTKLALSPNSPCRWDSIWRLTERVGLKANINTRTHPSKLLLIYMYYIRNVVILTMVLA